jgi:hypothetical protein
MPSGFEPRRDSWKLLHRQRWVRQAETEEATSRGNSGDIASGSPSGPGDPGAAQANEILRAVGSSGWSGTAYRAMIQFTDQHRNRRTEGRSSSSEADHRISGLVPGPPGASAPIGGMSGIRCNWCWCGHWRSPRTGEAPKKLW